MKNSDARRLGRSLRALLLVLLTTEVSATLGLKTLEWLRTRDSRWAELEYAPVDRLAERHRTLLERMLDGERSHRRISSELGWTLAENGRTDLYEINSAGIRSRREIALDGPPDTTRLLTFGDSFTFGDEVGNDDTWQARLERSTTGLEVVNFGVGGFGLDQSYLRYLREGRAYEADVVTIGFMSDNVFRHVNRFRPFFYAPTGIPLGKPRFRLEQEELVLMDNPLPGPESYRRLLEHPRETLRRIGQGDVFYEMGYESSRLDLSATVRLVKLSSSVLRRRLFPRGILYGDDRREEHEAFRVTTKLIDAFTTEVERNGDLPVVLLFPRYGDVERQRDGHEVSYAKLKRHLAAEGLRHVDLLEAFEPSAGDLAPGELFGRSHYSPLGNRLVADHLRHELARWVRDADASTDEL